jgi:hypothetical protein
MQGKTIKIMHDLLFAQEEGRSFDVFWRALVLLQCRYCSLEARIFDCCPSQSKDWTWGCTSNTVNIYESMFFGGRGGISYWRN